MGRLDSAGHFDRLSDLWRVFKFGWLWVPPGTSTGSVTFTFEEKPLGR